MSISPRLLIAAEDLRCYQRVSVGLLVDVGRGRGKPPRDSGNTLDLSASGALLNVSESYLSGSFLTVRFQDPPGGSLTCEAIVRTSIADRGVGVEFVDLSDDDQRRLGTLAVQGHR